MTGLSVQNIAMSVLQSHIWNYKLMLKFLIKIKELFVTLLLLIAPLTLQYSTNSKLFLAILVIYNNCCMPYFHSLLYRLLSLIEEQYEPTLLPKINLVGKGWTRWPFLCWTILWPLKKKLITWLQLQLSKV